MTDWRVTMSLAFSATLAITARADVDGRVIDARGSVRGCEVSLSSPPHEAVLLFRAACALDADHAREALTALLAQAWPDGARLHAPVSLSLGRIVGLPWLSEALERTALQSPGWDAVKGRPRAGHENAWVGRLLQDAGLLRPLDSAFATVGARARVASVEKVLVSPQSRAPFDAQLWLRLEPVAGGSPLSGP